jgi:TPR repeat protein
MTASAMAAPLADIDQALARGDYARVFAILWPRAQAREPEAEYRLSLLYGSGSGVTQNYALQAAWCRDAAEQNHAPAQLSLARLYYKGFGVVPDRIASYFWANLAASQSAPGPKLNEAILYRDFARNKLAAGEIDQAQQMAAAWRPKIATAGWSPMPQIASR